MAAEHDAVVDLTTEIRRAFQDLRALAEHLHRREGVNASMRSVLEHLDREGAQPVPTIARRKNVSRQHIQTIVDALTARGLVETRDNPKHKRSPLIAPTRQGKALFAFARERELEPVRALAARMDAREVRQATQTLSALREHIDEMLKQEKKEKRHA